MTRAWRARPHLAMLLLAAVAMGCSARDVEPPGDGKALVAPTCQQALAPGIETATISVYYHAYRLGWGDPAAAVPPFPILELGTAAQALSNSTDPRADVRRRRAIGILVAAGTPLPSGKWSPPEIDRALVALHAPAAIASRIRDAHLADAHIDTSTDTEAGRAYKQWVADDVLDHTDGPWKRKCCSCLKAYDVDAGSGFPTAMAWFRIEVQRPMKEIQPILDPQSWTCCYPEHFASSYLLDEEQCSETTPHEPCTAARFPSAQPEPPGTGWGCRVLYEHFSTSVPVGSTRYEPYYKNLLQVRAAVSDGYYAIDYGLCRPLDGNSGAGPGCTLVGEDCGYTRADPISSSHPENGTTVDAVKFLRYSDPTIGEWLDPGLRMLIQQTLYEGVCCGTTQTGCPDCPPTTVKEDIDPKADLCGPLVCKEP